jgi:hypothetical protein
MPRKHGRNGRLMVSLDGTAAPTTVTHAASWSFSSTTEKVDVTSFGDTNKVSVAGLPTANGNVSGFFDAAGTGTDALYNAAQDGVARAFYLYLDATDTTKDYLYGTALFDFDMSGGVDSAISFSADFEAASRVSFKR